ncbi:hypothetical protein H0I25_04100 [Cellulophaga sp. HaHa_2_95]|uniref:hypothetical protein n=2 Tax=unclassified Cellulophaga TaxID=2634405 RepID=UPI001C4F706B|nr:hypothetical protein [Cellulophaga sp. HaHa_2_95]QXP56986.1 hypothetical protein H0I25_04100 [Cellulophaga sp. HaHa_2_95]
MKKRFFFVLSVLLLCSSCKKELECDSLMANLSLRKELTAVHAKESAFFKLFNVDHPKYLLRELFNTKTNIHSIKTLPKTTNGSCHCQAQLSISFDEDLKSRILKAVNPNATAIISSYFDEIKSESRIEYEFSNPSKNSYTIKIIEDNKEELLRSIVYYIRLHPYEQALKTKEAP